MRILRFFELATEAVDEFSSIINLSQETKPSAKAQVIHVQSVEKFEVLSSVFSNPPKPAQIKSYEYNIGNYLHSLFVELSSEQQNKADKTTSTPDFLFLGTDPLTLLCGQGSDFGVLEKKLQLMKKELLDRKEKLISGWKTFKIDGQDCVVNFGTAEDWRVFFNCFGEYVGPSAEEKKKFLKKLESDDKTPFECRLSQDEFFKVHEYQGIKDPHETVFIESLKELPHPAIIKSVEKAPLRSQVESSNKSNPPQKLEGNGLSKEIIDIFARVKSQCILMTKTTKTLAPLKDPYDPRKESIVTDTFIKIDEFIKTLKEFEKIIDNLPESSAQISYIVDWLNRSSDQLFPVLFGSFYFLHYFGPTIQIAEACINFFEKLRGKSDKKQSTVISEKTHRLKEKYINSLLLSVRYDKIRSRLEYFDNLHTDICQKDHCDFFFEQADNFTVYAIISQVQLDFRRARDCLDTAWKYLESALLAFKSMMDVNQAQKFMSKAQLLSTAISSSYQALADQEFEQGDFRNACTTLQYSNERNEIKFRERALRALSLVVKNRDVGLTKSSENERELKSAKRITTRWCEIEQFISIKCWLEKNIPIDLILSTKNLSLVLSSSTKGCITKFDEKLTRAKIPHEKSNGRLIFKDFLLLELGKIKSVFSVAPSCVGSSEQTSHPSATSSDENIRFQRLLGMHNNSLISPADAYFNSLCEEFWLFCTQCRDPWLKLKALKTLICHRLARLLVSWDSNNDLDYEEIFKSIEKQVEEARACAQSIKDPEAYRILEPVEILLQNHKAIMQEYTRPYDISCTESTINTLCEEGSVNSLYGLAHRLESSKLLSRYKELSVTRTKFNASTLCYDEATYKKSRSLLEPLGIMCFKLAYELWISPSLVGVEGNSKETAMARLHEEYQKLVTLKGSLGFKFSAEVSAMTLVASTTLDQNLGVKCLSDFDTAFSKVENRSNTVFSILILLRKIDHIMGLSKDHYFPAIIDTLKTLQRHFVMINVNPKLRNEKNLNYIILEVTKQICRYTNLCQRPIHSYSIDSVQECFDLQLALLKQFNEALETTSSDDSKEAKEWVEAAEDALNNGKIILNALKVSTASTQTKVLLLPDLLSEISLMPTDPTLFDLTNTHLMKSVLLCAEISDYAEAMIVGDQKLPQPLCDAYRETAKIVVDYLCQSILPESVFKCFSAENTDPLWFKKLVTLIKSYQSAHLLKKIEKPEEVISLLRAVLIQYPNNPGLLFTLFFALSSNTDKCEDLTELTQSCKKAADLGHPQAQYYYARLLQKGRFQNTKDYETAKVYLEKSVKQGYYKAQYRMALLHQHGLFGFEQKQDFSFKYAKEALSNPETSQHLRKKLEDTDCVYFMPFQDFV